MRLNHRCLLTCGLAILCIVVALGTASAQSSTHRSAATKHHQTVLVRYRLHDTVPVSPRVPMVPVVSPGCYLPSDGCLSEYSVQN
jgi:hypothetical protein